MSFDFWEWAPALLALVYVFLLWLLWLLIQHLKQKRERERREASYADRRTPQHKRDEIPQNASDDDRKFYKDFAATADYLNMLYEETDFSFENTGKLEPSGYTDDAEREIKIWHGQLPSGSITIGCRHHGSPELAVGRVKFKLSLVNARFMSGNEVFSLATEVSRMVAVDEEDQKQVWLQIGILHRMVDAMWRTGEESTTTLDVDFVFVGRPPDWFFEHMQKRLQMHRERR